MHKTHRNSSQNASGPSPLEALIVEYLRHLQFATGYSRNTVKSYQSQLRRFHRWLEERLEDAPQLSDVTARCLRQYILELAQAGCRPRTIRAAVMPIRSLANFLVETDRLEASPIHSVRLPKKDPAQRPLVTEEELRALVAGCERLRGTERPLMARAALLTLITTAVRRSELLSLKVQDFLRDKGQLLITHGKGAKSRAIFLTEETQAALEAWLDVRPHCKHDYLFMVDINRRLGDLGLNSLLEEVKAAAGLRERDNILPHAIRHAAATRMQQRGMDLKSIQTILGHANIATTAVYLHVDEEHLRSVVHLASLEPEPSPESDQPPAAISQPEPRPRASGPSPAGPCDAHEAGAPPSRYQRLSHPERSRLAPGQLPGTECRSEPGRESSRPPAQPRFASWVRQRRRRR